MQGWVCPKCSASLSPIVQVCPRCSPRIDGLPWGEVPKRTEPYRVPFAPYFWWYGGPYWWDYQVICSSETV